MKLLTVESEVKISRKAKEKQGKQNKVLSMSFIINIFIIKLKYWWWIL